MNLGSHRGRLSVRWPLKLSCLDGGKASLGKLLAQSRKMFSMKLRSRSKQLASRRSSPDWSDREPILQISASGKGIDTVNQPTQIPSFLCDAEAGPLCDQARSIADREFFQR